MAEGSREAGSSARGMDLSTAFVSRDAYSTAGHHQPFHTSVLSISLQNQPMNAGEKMVWVGAVLGAEWKKRVIITSDKTLVKGALLIDDKIDIAGCCTPEWEHVVFSRPYQEHHKHKLHGRRVLHDWADWRSVVSSRLGVEQQLQAAAEVARAQVSGGPNVSGLPVH